MKRIALGIMALVLAFSAMAQTTDKNSQDKNSWEQKEHGKDQRHFKGGEMYDKLNLSDDQKAQIKTLNEGFRQQMKDLHQQGNLTDDQQKQKREALVKEHKEKVEAILTPEQRKQAETLKQEFKDNKKDGAHGERFEEMTKDLNLTADQSAKMSSMNSEFKTNMQSIKQNTTLSQDAKKDQIKSLVKKHRSDIEALLTNEQKEQLKSNMKNRTNRTAVK